MGYGAVRIKSEQHTTSMVELEDNLVDVDCLLTWGGILWSVALGVAVDGK